MNNSRISAALAAVFAASAIAAFADVEPQDYYGKIAKRLGDMLPKYHVLQKKLDDDISQKAWTNLVTYYDFDHSVFLKSDLDALSAREKRIDDEIHAGDPSFGFDVYNLYCRRLSERMDFVTNFLATAEWDFSTNETYRIKRKDAPWPETAEEANEHWRRRLKNEVLVQVLGAELDKSTNTVDAAGNLLKKYRQYYTVLTEPDEEAVLQHYLSAVAMAYDPHSDYMSPASKEDFDMEMNLTLCGVGAVLQMDEGALKIVEVMAGGPVDRDGRIKEGDKIVGVQQEDGEMEDVMWKPMKKTIKKIRGKKGTRVTLEIVPRSDSTGATKKLIELVRDEIKLEDQAATGRVETVTRGGFESRIGYIYLPGFYGTMDKRPTDPGFRSCAKDVAEYLAKFNAQAVEGLVLDLRGDGGGSLREAVLLSALFVPNGPVVQIKDSRNVGSLPIPYGNPVAFRKPMVVLTDRASASASEIVAGHLQDTGRAVVLGDGRTHGKGTVQTVFGMGPSQYGSMKITTARFYRVDGRSTQLEGVEADIRLPSLLDSLDIGEDKLPNALPFSRILPADYARCWNLNKYVPELKRLAEARLEKDERYQKHLENVRGMKEISEREVVSLERETRKAQMAADRELRELDDDDDEDGDSDGEEKPAKRRRRNERAKDDVVLDSAFDVLYDLIRLNGGAELPRPRTGGGWFNSIIGGGY
ncbi:MAG: carboxy terminal-processing peptidase [Kiritimatiellae bacterium]|jgi:carboxyl-terminal processing protease|nr:carboxy terminal-processing peptidase [Kiritimatiellia bacterium]